ncbi:hypothetical protein RvY_07529 [Ramazzottius varieornatus]|uniref:Uncharacterized protein n=1 Tax=Ramazzottius varieornatus TaxID=947166 RepID=A0A1D1V2I4_RAMVA|nr:hypothetical protein RvY_07529 [Ramazzottius varieornatus]
MLLSLLRQIDSPCGCSWLSVSRPRFGHPPRVVLADDVVALGSSFNFRFHKLALLFLPVFSKFRRPYLETSITMRNRNLKVFHGFLYYSYMILDSLSASTGSPAVSLFIQSGSQSDLD